jgi:hypothetical protein
MFLLMEDKKMSYTDYPNGITSFGAPVLPADMPLIAGNVFFVGSTASAKWVAGSDDPSCGTIKKPFATIDYAIGKCTASQGDVIYVLPGHTETIAAAGGITCDVVGVSIIGLGNGNLRPTITWSATASSWLVTAANVTIKNIITTISVDEVVSMFGVSAAGCTLDKVDFKEYGAKGATGQAIQFLLTTAGASELTVCNCYHKQQTAAVANQVWIDLVGTTNTKIINNTFIILAKAATASLCISGSTAVVGIEIAHNKIMWTGNTITGIINLVTTSTGIIYNNYVAGGSAVLLAATIVGDQCFPFNNYATNTLTGSGTLAPTVADVVT